MLIGSDQPVISEVSFDGLLSQTTYVLCRGRQPPQTAFMYVEFIEGRGVTQGVLACAEDLDEMNIEIMRNTLYKAYLDDFAAFCNKLGGTTAEVMGSLLSFEVRGQFPESAVPHKNQRHECSGSSRGIHPPMQFCCACRGSADAGTLRPRVLTCHTDVSR